MSVTACCTDLWKSEAGRVRQIPKERSESRDRTRLRTEAVTRMCEHDYNKGGRNLSPTKELMLLYKNKINLLFWKVMLKRTFPQEIPD